MAETSSIEWTDATFNPWIGCTRVSPGCDNCYAAAQDKFRSWTPEGWGGPRKRTSPANWRQPQRWNATPFHRCPTCGWRGDGGADGLACPHIDCSGKLVPARRRVFCSSLADVFDNEVPAQWRYDLFDLIGRTDNLDWLLLTKRIGNAAKMLPWTPDGGIHTWMASSALWPNVWLGATVVNQEEADRDIPKLLAIPARVRFLSMEPLLGPVEFSNVTRRSDAVKQLGKKALAGIDWVIVGGESGHGARPMHPDWARSLRDQCAAAGVPFLFKQYGEWRELRTGMQQPLVAREGDPEFERELSKHDGFLSLAGHFVTDPDDMQDDVRYRGLQRVGKKAAGRQLDGVTHDGFPEAR